MARENKKKFGKGKKKGRKRKKGKKECEHSLPLPRNNNGGEKKFRFYYLSP